MTTLEYTLHFKLSLIVCLAITPLASVVRAQAPMVVSANRDEGIKHYNNGAFKRAVESLRKATDADKNDSLAFNYLGLSLRATGDMKGARKAYEKAVNLRPDAATLRAGLADILLSLNKSKDAEKEARNAFALDPQNPDVNLVLGTIRLFQHSCGAAEAHANDALKRDPNLAPAYLLRSRAIVCGVGVSVTPQRDLTAAEIIANRDKASARFADAADSLEKFLKMDPSAELSLWKAQLSALRAYASRIDPDNGAPILSTPEVTIKARVLRKPEPEYTALARETGVEGRVVLRAVFSADGSVRHLIVINSLPHGLTEKAVAAARKIKFEPATKDGRPVSMAFQLEYYFNLY